MVPDTDCLLIGIDAAPAMTAPDVVNVCPAMAIDVPTAIAPSRLLTAIEVMLLPDRLPLRVAEFGVPTPASCGSSGGLSELLMKPALSVMPAANV